MFNACTDCVHYEWNQDSDDHYITAEWVECKRRPAIANLKQFPFKKTECVDFESRNKQEPDCGGGN